MPKPHPYQKIFPDALVEAGGNNSSVVRISDANTGTKVVEVPQRDLYRKYRWPAEPKIVQMLEVYKETMEDD